MVGGEEREDLCRTKAGNKVTPSHVALRNLALILPSANPNFIRPAYLPTCRAFRLGRNQVPKGCKVR